MAKLTKAQQLAEDWKQVEARTPAIAVGGMFHVTMQDGSWVHATVYEITPEGKVVLNGFKGEYDTDALDWIGPNHEEP